MFEHYAHIDLELAKEEIMSGFLFFFSQFVCFSHTRFFCQAAIPGVDCVFVPDCLLSILIAP